MISIIGSTSATTETISTSLFLYTCKKIDNSDPNPIPVEFFSCDSIVLMRHKPVRNGDYWWRMTKLKMYRLLLEEVHQLQTNSNHLSAWSAWLNDADLIDFWNFNSYQPIFELNTLLKSPLWAAKAIETVRNGILARLENTSWCIG